MGKSNLSSLGRNFILDPPLINNTPAHQKSQKLFANDRDEDF